MKNSRRPFMSIALDSTGGTTHATVPPAANATQTSARDAIGDEEGSLVSLRTGRTSFAMAILGRPQGGPLWVARSTRDPSARLVVTGGVSGMADELFLSDTELLPLMGPQRHVAPAGRDNAGVPSCPDILQAMVSVPRTPQPRSGCRSVVLWPMPRRRFLPWLSSCEKEHNSTAQDPVAEGGATPFLVVLGGETPNQNGVMMEPCQEPIALDVVGGCWHSSTHSVAREAPGAFARRTDHDDFLEAVGRLRTGRVAFAMAVAQGLPRVATQAVEDEAELQDAMTAHVQRLALHMQNVVFCRCALQQPYHQWPVATERCADHEDVIVAMGRLRTGRVAFALTPGPSKSPSAWL
eukprot:CAMPEP_0117532258 /NCGR_PEP_ID=MMETSP0784-20121206/39275_1 /TAXON_ID=39447 /ORGANISM="" /LENGTH=350 /DNA_ID=CAMNT_0005328645 /DNA_START=52 /DNA_END=1105 /DNA_ORIENTATION=+